MTQEEPTTFLGRCTTLANGDGHNKGYNRIHVASEFTNTRTNISARTLVNIISILNITRYTTQVNRQKLNEVMDALQKADENMNIILKITDVLTQHLRYHQIYMYAHIILAYPRDCLAYMRKVATHTLDYVDAAMTNILSPDILPVEDSEPCLDTSKHC